MDKTLEKRKLLDFLKSELLGTLEKLSKEEIGKNREIAKKTEKIKKMISFPEVEQRRRSQQ